MISVFRIRRCRPLSHLSEKRPDPYARARKLSTTPAPEQSAEPGAQAGRRRGKLRPPAHAQHGGGQVVERAALVGGVDQALAGGARVAALEEPRHLFVLERVVETVAADQQHVVAE